MRSATILTGMNDRDRKDRNGAGMNGLRIQSPVNPRLCALAHSARHGCLAGGYLRQPATGRTRSAAPQFAAPGSTRWQRSERRSAVAFASLA